MASCDDPFRTITFREWLFSAHCLDTKLGFLLVVVGLVVEWTGWRPLVRVDVGVWVTALGVTLLLRTLWVDLRLVWMRRTSRSA